ncbi:MAG: hypothetical protein ACRDQH_05155, partial [Pseudonocardiaceae bacterium]
GWKTVRYQGIQVRVPADWPVRAPSACTVVPTAPPRVGMGPPSGALCEVQAYRQPAGDGLAMTPVARTADGSAAVPPAGGVKTLSGPPTSELAVSLFDTPGPGNGSSIGAFLAVADNSMTVTVGLGVDPTIAEAVIDSISLYQPSPMTQASVNPVSPSPSQFEAQQLSHSGGPYVSAISIEEADLTSLRCPLPAHLTGTRDLLPATPAADVAHAAPQCASVTVKFFPTFTAAAAAQPGLVQPGGINPDSEIYLVTVHGALPFLGSCICVRPAIVAWDNGLYDATTGTGLGGGTAGTPLP